MLISVITKAHKVFSVEYAKQADVKVFVDDYESRADLSVFKLEYESRSDKKIFFVDYASQADVIFLLNTLVGVGWKNKDKKHLFF